MPLDFQPFLHRFLKHSDHKASAQPPVKNSLITPAETDLPRAGYGSASTIEPGRKDSSGSFTFNMKDNDVLHPQSHPPHNHFQPHRRASVWDSLTEFTGGKTSRSNSIIAIPPKEDWEHWADNNLTKQDQPVEKDKMGAISKKYGDIIQVTGLGDYAVILQSHKVQYCPPLDQYYGLKVFRLRDKESRDDYKKRVTNEYDIVSDLRHQNIIRTFELLPIGGGNLCAAMEYCSGGDVHSLITASQKLPADEADCIFKQLLRGVRHLHEQGVAHRDLKPENLLLTHRGCLKITDFGHAERFREAGDPKDTVRLTTGRRNSRPYLSPEQFLPGEFDPRLVDVWAAAVVYVAMRTGRNLWKEATEKDEGFRVWKASKTNSIIDGITNAQTRKTFDGMLSIDPAKRPHATEVLDSDWLKGVQTCVPAPDA